VALQIVFGAEHALATGLEVFSTADVLALYRLRWRIEISKGMTRLF